VVATVATESKTVFPVIPSHDNLMCSVQAKSPVFGSYLKGKMLANAIVLGASHPQLREEPPKGPHQTVAALEPHWTSVDT
jgi:hypothetical protein